MEDIDDLPQQSKAFATIATKNKNTAIIIDALNLAFRYLHSGKRDFAEDYYRTVESLANSYKAGKIIIAADHGSSSYRKAIYPEYKQNRKDKYELQTEEEKDKFNAFFSDFEAMLNSAPPHWNILRFNGVEADDIAAYIVNNMRIFNIDNLWLISSDKDWDLLISDKVSRFSYVTRKETTINNWYDHYECDIDSYLGLKCLQGDAGDNIKGVAGVGPKRAVQLLSEYGSIFDLIESIPIKGTQKFIQAVNNSKDQLLQNIELMDLVTFCADAIGENNIKEIINKLC